MSGRQAPPTGAKAGAEIRASRSAQPRWCSSGQRPAPFSDRLPHPPPPPRLGRLPQESEREEAFTAAACRKLLYLGRDYPKGADYFKRRLKSVFLKNKDVKDPEKIKELIEQGKFVMKELEALYFLRKYRAMKQRYYSDTNKTN
ncbi:hypothetical protein J1605_006618 [Eschrichtius robustus]|uniref:Complex 1 LYR protein domain-containing protein n=1 Tax=Eschrichtius robustus TaxID=9764 RepID=A0AB34H2Q4_ESCRO|nr:hypothetical protein J1605_006618 [Eschrichtius robustus]